MKRTGPPETLQRWDAACQQVVRVTYGAVVLILIALPLVEYLRYGRRPQWIFWDLPDFIHPKEWRGALIAGETLFSFFLLGATALLSLLHYATITKVTPLSRPSRFFWLLSGLGFLWLACDEFFGFHEYVEWRLLSAGIPPPPVGKLKDLIMPGIPVIVGFMAFVRFRKAWRPYRARLRFVAAGGIFLVISLLFDVFHPVRIFPRRIIEDGAKILAGTSFLLFYLLAYLDAIGSLLRTPPPCYQ